MTSAFDPRKAALAALQQPRLSATDVAMRRKEWGEDETDPLPPSFFAEGLDPAYAPAAQPERRPTSADMRAQVEARSGTGAPGMVYAQDDTGGVTLTSLDSAMRNRWRVVDADEARQLGAADEARRAEDIDLNERLGAAQRKDGERIIANLDAGQDPARRPFKGLSPEDAASLDAQQERFQQGLRLAGQPAPRTVAGGALARRPRVDVSTVGPVGPMPQARPLSAPVPRAEGADASTATASVGRDTSGKPPGDAEFAAAQDEADSRRMAVALGRAGAQINRAISGQGFDEGAYNEMAQGADSPVRRLLAQREADRKRALEDPTSEQSKRVQAAVAKAMPGVYSHEELANITAADADMVTKYGAMKQRLEERKADMAREDVLRAAKEGREDRIRKEEQVFQAQQAGAGRAFQASQADKLFRQQKELAGINNAADLEQAALRAKLGPDGQPINKGTTIPGLEIEPGAAPTAEDAKKVKASRVSAEKMRGYVAELRALHDKYGTEYGGPVGTRMEQLGKAIQLEAKTIAELGALSGPDQALMESISGADPASLSANMKALVGIDNTATALQGLEKWVGTQEGATQRVYGYRPASGGQPQASTGGERKQYSPSRNMTRVLDAQGNVIRTEQGDTRG